MKQDVLNTYCWIHSTYTIPSAFWKRIGIDVAHPGIDKTIDPEERRYVRYYQWVCFCLFFQVGLTGQRKHSELKKGVAKCSLLLVFEDGGVTVKVRLCISVLVTGLQ